MPGDPLDLTAAQVKALLAIANTDVSGLGTMAAQNARGRHRGRLDHRHHGPRHCRRRHRGVHGGCGPHQPRSRGRPDIASGATTDLGSVNSISVRVTGTTTITSFGTTPNLFRIVTFAAALTLTHNATSLILQGGSTIATAAGDVAIFASDASGNWRCYGYTRSSTSPFFGRNLGGGSYGVASIASTATTDLSPATAYMTLVTGNTTITSFGTGINLLRIVRFAASLTLTHNATSLILPGGINITTAAEDVGVFASGASGNWRSRAAPAPAPAIPKTSPRRKRPRCSSPWSAMRVRAGPRASSRRRRRATRRPVDS